MKMKKFEEFGRSEAFRDPIYNYIYLDYIILEKLINTQAFQRLRRIRQLGCMNMIFHGAEHSRFTHSLGVYELSRRLLTFKNIKTCFDARTKMLLMITALMHDIGHGPYSHVFENFFCFQHEKKSAQIIVSNPEISSLLDNYIDNNFKYDVASILNKENKFPLLEQILTSQLDIDRLDYLERDAYFTGVTYGYIDTDRLMRSMIVHNQQIVFKLSGISAIENYLINRYHMYWQCYHHPKVRSYQVILEKIYQRIKVLMQQNFLYDEYTKLLSDFFKFPDDINIYLAIDDYYINGLITNFKNSEDLILKTLCKDFLDRKIWYFIDNNENNQAEIKKIVNYYKKNNQEQYYTKLTNITKSAYNEEKEKNFNDKILILNDNNDIQTLKEHSCMINSITKDNIKQQDSKFFYRPFLQMTNA